MMHTTITAVIWVLFLFYLYVWRQDHKWLRTAKRFRRHGDDVDAMLNHWYLLITVFVVCGALTGYLWLYF